MTSPRILVIDTDQFKVAWHGTSRQGALIFLADEIGFSLKAEDVIVKVEHQGYGNDLFTPAEFAAWVFACPKVTDSVPA